MKVNTNRLGGYEFEFNGVKHSIRGASWRLGLDSKLNELSYNAREGSQEAVTALSDFKSKLPTTPEEYLWKFMLDGGVVTQVLPEDENADEVHLKSMMTSFSKLDFEDMETRYRESIYISETARPVKGKSLRLHTEAELLGVPVKVHAKQVKQSIDEYQVTKAKLLVSEKIALRANTK